MQARYRQLQWSLTSIGLNTVASVRVTGWQTCPILCSHTEACTLGSTQGRYKCWWPAEEMQQIVACLCHSVKSAEKPKEIWSQLEIPGYKLSQQAEMRRNSTAFPWIETAHWIVWIVTSPWIVRGEDSRCRSSLHCQAQGLHQWWLPILLKGGGVVEVIPALGSRICPLNCNCSKIALKEIAFVVSVQGSTVCLNESPLSSTRPSLVLLSLPCRL